MSRRQSRQARPPRGRRTRPRPGGRSDLRITTEDDQLHQLLTHRLDPGDAVAKGVVTLEGDVSELPRLIELFSFPALDPSGAT
jgi:hypothetical protein